MAFQQFICFLNLLNGVFSKPSKNIRFYKQIPFQEAPEVLPKDIRKKIEQGIAKRILSNGNEKWWTAADCFNEIDTLRDKYSDENDDEKLKFLDELNDHVTSIQKKYENM